MARIDRASPDDALLRLQRLFLFDAVCEAGGIGQAAIAAGLHSSLSANTTTNLPGASSSSAALRKPLLPSDRKNLRGESAKNCFPFQFHSVFLSHAARGDVVGMNQRNDL